MGGLTDGLLVDKLSTAQYSSSMLLLPSTSSNSTSYCKSIFHNVEEEDAVRLVIMHQTNANMYNILLYISIFWSFVIFLSENNTIKLYTLPAEYLQAGICLPLASII